MKKPASFAGWRARKGVPDHRQERYAAIGLGEAVPTTTPPANLKSNHPSQTVSRDPPSVVVCGHGAGNAVRLVNAAGNFVGLLAKQAFASILKRDEAAPVVVAIRKGDGAHTNGMGHAVFVEIDSMAAQRDGCSCS